MNRKIRFISLFQSAQILEQRGLFDNNEKFQQNRYAPIRKKRLAMNWIILFGNLIFVYIWGYKGWQEAEYNTDAWWFDSYGHMIFGFCWAFILLYWAKRYLLSLYVQIPKWVLAIVIILAVSSIETLVWENYEFGIWDSLIQPAYPYLPKAQKGSPDTMMDINFTTAAAILAMIFWCVYRKFCVLKWPNEAAEEMREEMIKRNKLSVDEINSLQTEHRRFVRTKIKEWWEKVFQEK